MRRRRRPRSRRRSPATSCSRRCTPRRRRDVGRMVEFFPPIKQARSARSSRASCAASQPAAAARLGGGRVARRRGDGQERTDRRPDPRGPVRRDRRRDRRGRVLPDADFHRGADRARPRGRGRARGRGERRNEPPRLPRRVRAALKERALAAPPQPEQEPEQAHDPEPRWNARAPRASHGGRRRRRGPGAPRRAGCDPDAADCRTRGAVRRVAAFAAAALTLALAGTAGRGQLRRRPAVDRELASRRGRAPARQAARSPRSPPGARAAQVPLSTLRASSGAPPGAPMGSRGRYWRRSTRSNPISGATWAQGRPGAVGWMQFMPSTWLRWGVDANGDGVAESGEPGRCHLLRSPLSRRRRRGKPTSGGPVFAYNHADWYVNEVLGLASLYGQGSAEALVELDRLQVEVEGLAADRSRDLNPTGRGRRAGAHGRSHTQRAAAIAESGRERSARLRSAGRPESARSWWGIRRVAADGPASAELQERSSPRPETSSRSHAGDRARGASFASAACAAPVGADLLGELRFSGRGRPRRQVSVSAGHHDYPAADIAAPEGSPVYALADALVARAWAEPEGNCGIGAMLATADGRTWTYCHLSYLDPAVHAGSLAHGRDHGGARRAGPVTPPDRACTCSSTRPPRIRRTSRGSAPSPARRSAGPGDTPTRALASRRAPSRPLFVLLDQPSTLFSSGTTARSSSARTPLYFTR